MTETRFYPIRIAAVGSLLLYLAFAGSALGQTGTLSGRVVRITGPNQVVVEGPGGAQYEVQLRGTLAPSTGNPASGLAQERLTSDLLGRHVTVDNLSGSANRLQGEVYYGDSDVNREWVREGLLRYDEENTPDDSAEAYRAAEIEARLSERGIWRPMDTLEPASSPGPALPSQPTVLEPPPGGWQFRPEAPRASGD